MQPDLIEAWQSLHDAMGAAKPNCMVFVSPWALRRVLDEQLAKQKEGKGEDGKANG